MNFFKRIAAALGTGAPQDDMASRYPSAALATTSSFSAYPPKVFLKEKGIFAYRLEFATFEADAIRVVQALGSEFILTDQATFQEGQSRHGDKSVHFSVRPEFNGAVVVGITNSIVLIEKIDNLHIEPPPPWFAFPDVDPSTLGALQGSMAYWWDWLFSPFWSALDGNQRVNYLSRFPPPHEDWLDFLLTRGE
jgi:hypothetical protein